MIIMIQEVSKLKFYGYQHKMKHDFKFYEDITVCHNT